MKHERQTIRQAEAYATDHYVDLLVTTGRILYLTIPPESAQADG